MSAMIAYRSLLSGCLLLVCTVSPAWAQAPLVADAPLPGADFLRIGSSPEPDTTDWHRYFPLEIGNQWQYRVDLPDGGTRYYGYDVVGDTLLEGEHYFLIRRCRPLDPVQCSDVSEIQPYNVVRYAPDAALLLQRIEIDGQPFIEWWEHVPCLLDADFDSGPVACAGDQAEYFVTGGHGYDYVLAPDTLRGVTFKQFDSIPTVSGVVAGVGVIWIQDVKNTGNLDVLVYARVGGEEYGERYFDFPTASESTPPDLSATGIRAVYPNPTRDVLSVVVALSQPEAVSVEVVDMSGRVVLRRDLNAPGSGEHTVSLDASRLSAGVYFVRAQMVAPGGAVQALTQKLTLVK